MNRPAPDEDAHELLMAIMEFAGQARADGWEVNLATETGAGVERLTFSAQRATRPPLPLLPDDCVVPRMEACGLCGSGVGEPCRRERR